MASLSAERLATLELDHDELGGVSTDVFRKMNGAVTASQRTARHGRRFGRAIGQSEVERLVGEKHDAAGGMLVHHRLVAAAVLDAKESHQLVLERYGIVTRIRCH